MENLIEASESIHSRAFIAINTCALRWCWEFGWELWWWKSASAQQTFSKNKYLQHEARRGSLLSCLLICLWTHKYICGAQVAFTSVLPEEITFNKKTLFKRQNFTIIIWEFALNFVSHCLPLVIAQSWRRKTRWFLSISLFLLYFHISAKMEQKTFNGSCSCTHSEGKSFPLGVWNVFAVRQVSYLQCFISWQIVVCKLNQHTETNF